MRILFMGTPDFAVHSLSALLEAGHEICGVFSREDKPRGRGMKVFPTPVKEYAMSHGIPVFTPAKLRDGTALALIKELAPELIAVTAYGRILPREILEYPQYGCINVHASLLPKYRGAAPINWSIVQGEAETGITIMYMAEELDSGDIVIAKSTPISQTDDAVSLWSRMGPMGGALLVEAVAAIEAGTAVRTPQRHAEMTLAPMLSREHAPLDFTKTAQQLHNQVRGLIPWPATTATLVGRALKVFRTCAAERRTDFTPGSLVQADKQGLFVACGGGSVLELIEIQGEGSKRMEARAYLLGKPFRPEDIGL